MVISVTPGQLGMATPFWELLGASDAEMNAELADYARLGANWIRTDFAWSVVQGTADGTYDWTKLDRIVAGAEKYGIQVIGLLNGVPSWVSASGGMASAANQSAFADFAAAAEQHFGSRVNAWEIWNEPNMQWAWGSAPNAADYTKLLTASYDAIKLVSPSDTVITGGLGPMAETLTGSYVRATDFLDAIYTNGGGGHFDAVGFHPYTWPRLPDDPAPGTGWDIMQSGLRNIMLARGDGGLQIWMTEFGSPTKGSSADETTQAQTLQRATDMAHSLTWAGPILWYSYQDRGGKPNDTENWFGLLRPDGSKKPAYTTYQSIALYDGGPGEPSTPPARPSELRGTSGADTIAGTDGADRIIGGKGNDTMRGGGGADDFVFVRGDGFDWILDFRGSEDRLVFQGVKRSDVKQILTIISGQSGLDVVYGTDNASHVFLQGVTAKLAANDLVFT